MSKIAEIIKYEGDNSTFVWKHPCEDFNSMTQLIVHESQEAIFFLNGEALDLFGPGRHTLETQNIPKLGKLLNKNTGGETPFHCEVYFINKTVQMALKWGTDSRVRFLDTRFGFPIEIGACGELNLAVSDSRKLLLKLVGTMRGIAWGDRDNFTKSIQNSFRPLISTAVKANLAASIKNNNISIFEIDENLEKLSDTMRNSILGGFEEYGLTIPQFYITSIMLPENDKNFQEMKTIYATALKAEAKAAERKLKLEDEITLTEVKKRQAERTIIDAQASAEARKISGFAEAEVMRAQGYNKKDELQAEVQKEYAKGIGNMTINGGGGVAGDMIGLGVGMVAAGAVAPQLGEMFKGFTPTAPTQTDASEAKCAKCGATLPANAKFCFECGEKVAPAVPSDMIVCPECGKTVTKGKFCAECGHKFVTVCPKCGKDVVSGAKFCLECGEKL